MKLSYEVYEKAVEELGALRGYLSAPTVDFASDFSIRYAAHIERQLAAVQWDGEFRVPEQVAIQVMLNPYTSYALTIAKKNRQIAQQLIQLVCLFEAANESTYLGRYVLIEDLDVRVVVASSFPHDFIGSEVESDPEALNPIAEFVTNALASSYIDKEQRAFIGQQVHILHCVEDRTERLFCSGSFSNLPRYAYIKNIDQIKDRNELNKNIVESLYHEAIHAYIYSLESQWGMKFLPDKLRTCDVHSPWSGNKISIDSFIQAIFVWYGIYNLWKEKFPEKSEEILLGFKICRRNDETQGAIKSLPREIRRIIDCIIDEMGQT